MSSQNRKVYDSVYGFITFPKQIWEFIDSPHFQRLRNIKQLGCLSWVFPGAVHSRFQHCLGTGHLAQKYITTLIEKHRKNRDINPKVYDEYCVQGDESQKFKTTIEEAIFIVTLAGVLHDIGHGPFSHLFDSKVVATVNNKKWEHQIASLCLIDNLYEFVIKQKDQQKDKKEIQWLKSTKDRVKSLIIGKITQKKYKKNESGQFEQDGIEEVDNLQDGFNEIFKRQLRKRPWEFQLISNRITGIDVDKLDYFRRDAYYVGAKNIYIDHQLLMNQTLILEDKTKFITPQSTGEGEDQRHRLAYPSKYSDKVYDIYYSRYKLYRTYYMSLKANGVDFMLAQILQQADKKFNFKGACEQLLEGNCERYIRLTDSILQKIDDAYEELLEKRDKQDGWKEVEELSVEDQAIFRAGCIQQKLKRRQIYDFIKEYHMQFSYDDRFLYQKVKQKIKRLLKQEKQNKGIVIQNGQIGFGIKDRDPFEHCKFYDKAQETKVIEQTKQRHFSMLRPKGIVEITLRIYMKERMKNPTSEQKAMIKDLQNSLERKIKDHVHGNFISGQSGTFTDRSQKRNQNNNGLDEESIKLNNRQKQINSQI